MIMHSDLMSFVLTAKIYGNSFVPRTIDNAVRSNNTERTMYYPCSYYMFTAHLPLSFSDINLYQ